MTADTEADRQRFERFWLDSRRERKRRELLPARRDDGTYADNSVQRHWWTWQHAAGNAQDAARAFEIADEAMFELLLSEGCLSDGIDSTVIGLVDESGAEVHTLAQARDAIHEAFEWPQQRGYVELGTDQAGEFINVVRRPGEDGDGVATTRKEQTNG